MRSQPAATLRSDQPNRERLSTSTGLAISVVEATDGDYLAVPSIGRPRLLVPRPLVTRVPYRRFEAGRSLKSLAFRFGLRMGAIAGDPVHIEGADEIRRWVADHVEAPVSLVIRPGTPGAYQKVTALVLGQDGRAVAVAKVAAGPRANAKLRHEASVLTRLAEHERIALRVPGIIAFGSSADFTAMLVAVAPGRPGPNRWGPPHDSFAGLLMESTGRRGDVLSSAMWSQVTRELEAMQARLTAAWRERLKLALDHIAAASIREVSLSLAHRDFTPWNTRLDDEGRLFVFDWEFAEYDYPTCFDELHFTASQAAWRTSGATVQGWKNSAEHAGFAMTLAYLADVSLFYLRARHDAPGTGTDAFVSWLASQLDEIIRGQTWALSGRR